MRKQIELIAADSKSAMETMAQRDAELQVQLTLELANSRASHRAEMDSICPRICSWDE